MTNLAYRQSVPCESNLTYFDFAANAARKAAQKKHRLLCLQHRYGVVLLLVCAICTAVSLTTATTDLTALLILLPLALYLLFTKEVILYSPGTNT